MSVYSDLTAVERAEIDQAVGDSFAREDGSVRTLTEATEHFLMFIASATQAHRSYADALRSEWETVGAARFLRDRRKSTQVTFRGEHGEPVRRSSMRGTRIVTSSGGEVWIQEDIHIHTREMLEQGIRDAAAQIDSVRITIATYRALLALLDEHPSARFVADALAERGTTLDEYLAAAVGGAA